MKKEIVIIATRDFRCGPDRELVIRRGSKKTILESDWYKGSFWTTGVNGGGFGACHPHDGWELENHMIVRKYKKQAMFK